MRESDGCSPWGHHYSPRLTVYPRPDIATIFWEWTLPPQQERASRRMGFLATAVKVDFCCLCCLRRRVLTWAARRRLIVVPELGARQFPS